MNIQERLASDMKAAMKAGEKFRLGVIRMIRSELKNEEIARGGRGYDLSEKETLEVLSRAAKQRRDAIREYENGGRTDLAEKEKKELIIIQEYMPEQLTEEEIEKLVAETMEDVGATSPKDIGKVMSKIMPKVKGKADGRLVNRIVTEKLK
jgi:hypothetical protein